MSPKRVDLLDSIGAADFHVDPAHAHELDALIGLERAAHADEELDVLVKPGPLQFHLQLQAVAHERQLLVVGLGEDRQQVVEVILELVEATPQVVVIIAGNRRGPPGLLLEDGQLTDQPAQLLVGHEADEFPPRTRCSSGWRSPR